MNTQLFIRIYVQGDFVIKNVFISNETQKVAMFGINN